MRETPGLLPELVRIFFEQNSVDMERLHAAVLQSDAKESERLAHSIKSTVSNFAAKPAFEAASSLERIARDGHVEQVKEGYAVLAREVVRLQSALKTLTEEANP
jgi:HPt (histidine-containing phosphotransfer) domain-containing protein